MAAYKQTKKTTIITKTTIKSSLRHQSGARVSKQTMSVSHISIDRLSEEREPETRTLSGVTSAPTKVRLRQKTLMRGHLGGLGGKFSTIMQE